MMKRYLLSCLIILGLFLFPHSLFGQKNSCIECHQQLEGELQAPVEAFKLDIHQQFGISCKDCHGGNPAEDDIDLAKDKSFRGVPSRVQIPDFCASCHSNSQYMRAYNPSLRIDQLALYWTSQHGHLLKRGDTKAAICTDCHGVHGIQASKQPKSLTFPWNIPQMCGSCHSNADYMKGYKIPTKQLEEYKQSVHARALFEKKDLSAPTCNDCHGNHGAIPPEVTSIAYVCRQCHLSTAELFSRSPHSQAFDEMGISECEACHSNHKILPPTDNMLGTGEESVCIQCHEADSKPYQIASQMKQALDEFVSKFEDAQSLLERAEGRGVEVSESKFRLQEANTALILIRNLTHSLSMEEIEEKISEGEKIVSEVKTSGEAALSEAIFRRKGLVIATIFLILLAIALFLKIRQMSKKPSH